MAPIRRLVLDLMKPHEPGILDFAQAIADLDGTDGVNVIVVEIDEKVENVKMTVEGDGIDYDAVKTEIEDLGGSVHSIDEIVCGDRVVEESKTPQD